MPIKPEEALSVLGFDKLDSFEKPEDFKAAVDKKFISRDHVAEDEDLVSSITGKMFGSVEAEVKRVFKEAGVEFEPSDITKDGKKRKLFEIAQTGLTKLASKHREEVDGLKSAVSGDSAKELEKWQTKYTKLEQSFQQEKDLREKTAQEIEALKSGFDGEKKNWVIDQKRKDLFGQMKYKGGLAPEVLNMAKTGFEKAFSDKYNLDLDEQQNIILLDKSGKKVSDPKKSGQFLSPLDGMKNLAIDQKIWEDNPHNGKRVPSTQFGTPSRQDGSEPKRKVPAGRENLALR